MQQAIGDVVAGDAPWGDAGQVHLGFEPAREGLELHQPHLGVNTVLVSRGEVSEIGRGTSLRGCPKGTALGFLANQLEVEEAEVLTDE